MPKQLAAVSVIGLGNMGTAVADLIARKGFRVTGWDHFPEVAGKINRSHRNPRFLPGAKLCANLTATPDISTALASGDFVFIALPSAYLKTTLRPAARRIRRQAVVISMSKGADSRGFPASAILKKIFPKNQIAVLSGPSIANEFHRGWPCVVMLAGKNPAALRKVRGMLTTRSFRARISTDTTGVEWGGILKNIYAIGLGILDGAGFRGVNASAAFISDALQEMAALIEAMGGKRETVLGPAALGDLVATSLSRHSHNRRMGQYLARGLSLAQSQKKLGVFPEGIKTLRTALCLARKHRISMPIARSIANVTGGQIKGSSMPLSYLQPED